MNSSPYEGKKKKKGKTSIYSNKLSQLVILVDPDFMKKKNLFPTLAIVAQFGP